MPATIAALDPCLPSAIHRALRLDRAAAAIYGARFTWERATDQFLAALELGLRPEPRSRPTDAPRPALAPVTEPA